MLGMKRIAPHETIDIDVKSLRDNQTPDEAGRRIPLDVSVGQFRWSLKQTAAPPAVEDDRQGLALIGRSEQIDLTNGIISSYACQNCCLNSYYSSSLSPLSQDAEVGDVVHFTVFQQDKDCEGVIGPPYIRTYIPGVAPWSSSNTQAATVDSSGTVTTVGGGDTTIQAAWFDRIYTSAPCGPGSPEKQTPCQGTKNSLVWINAPPCGACSYTTAYPHPSAVLSVIPHVQKIQYKVNGVWTDVPYGGIGPVCNGTSIDFMAIPTSGSFPSGKPTWGGDASGTGAEKTVTFSTAGSRTVSATSGNTLSTSVTVGPVNANIGFTWLSPNITVDSGSVVQTLKAPTIADWDACADPRLNLWRLRVLKVSGQTDILIGTGGYRDASTSPPTSQAEAIDAVTEMNRYYPEGGRASWHTYAASLAHEMHHNSEWICEGDHFWPQTESAIESITCSYTTYTTKAAAINNMRLGNSGGIQKILNMVTAAGTYQSTLSDAAYSRPYGAGQVVLNGEISNIRNLASANGWMGLPATANPNPLVGTPCYQPFQTYNP